MLEIRPILSAMLRNKSSALLLIVQIALTLAIVSNAAFIITDRIAYMNRTSGTVEHELFTFSVFTFGHDAKPMQQIAEDLDMLRALPGVIDATISNQVPLSDSGSSWGFRTNADREATDGRNAGAGIYQADTRILSTLGLKLAEGRNFREDEVMHGDDRASVMMVTREMADRLFPDGDALGKTVYNVDTPREIIGIVEKLQVPWVNWRRVDSSVILPEIRERAFQKYIVRTTSTARADIMKDIQQQMLALYPDRVINELNHFNQLRKTAYANDALMSKMLTVLIAALLLITGLGIVGMAFFNVSRRTKQIGTRRALGASKTDIVRYFIVENTLVATIGIIIGAGLSLVLNHLLISNFSLPKIDYAFIVATLMGIYLLGLVAVFWPARRAAGISPATATRNV